MTRESAPDRPTIARLRRQRRTTPRALLVLGPMVLAFAVAGCTAIEDTTDYIGDMFSYFEGDEEIFGSGSAPGADEPYRSLHEVPSEAPVMSSAKDRATLTASLMADRAQAQHEAAALRVRIEGDEQAGDGTGNGQIRAVYRPAEGAAVLAPSNDG